MTQKQTSNKQFTGRNAAVEINDSKLVGEFIAEKTSDLFWEVKFLYGSKEWSGAIPVILRYQGYDASSKDASELIEHFHSQLDFKMREKWKKEAFKKWEDQETQTYKVFEALLSGEWECRVCGPVPKVNPQAASRIRDIKKKGFIIASKRKSCCLCNKTQMHDLLIMAKLSDTIAKSELRKPIPVELGKRIIKVLEHKECVFDQVRTKTELIIDHKFPSQRWSEPESNNNLSMTDASIKKKFQLLSNQTNMLKSRECDKCVKTGLRGQFMGIRWYYTGDESWAKKFDDPEGCKGCPWYDVNLWKKKLVEKLSS
jgi:hypothetical protein